MKRLLLPVLLLAAACGSNSTENQDGTAGNGGGDGGTGGVGGSGNGGSGGEGGSGGIGGEGGGLGGSGGGEGGAGGIGGQGGHVPTPFDCMTLSLNGVEVSGINFGRTHTACGGREATLVMRNDCSEDRELSSALIVGEEFELIAPPIFGTVLSPAEEAQYLLAYNPSNAGADTGTLQVGIEGVGTFEIGLAGEGHSTNDKETFTGDGSKKSFVLEGEIFDTDGDGSVENDLIVRITTDGETVTVPAIDTGVRKWRFGVATNSIDFVTAPASGATIEVSYKHCAP